MNTLKNLWRWFLGLFKRKKTVEQIVFPPEAVRMLVPEGAQTIAEAMERGSGNIVIVTPAPISEVPQNIKDLPFAKRGYSLKTRKGSRYKEKVNR